MRVSNEMIRLTITLMGSHGETLRDEDKSLLLDIGGAYLYAVEVSDLLCDDWDQRLCILALIYNIQATELNADHENMRGTPDN